MITRILQSFFIALCIMMLLVVAAKGQVTIGSTGYPLKGSILQLKENNNPDANSSRGLGLPRVGLNRVTELNITGSVLDRAEHMGLLVYNVNEQGDSICPGAHVWTGDMWERIPESPREFITDIRTKRDGTKEINQYMVRTFGEGGTWMLSNLRATTYADNLGVDKTTNDLKLNMNSAGSQIEYYYYYPQKDVQSLVNFPERGLLYSWAAASIGTTSTQGICPEGWHIPTSLEWSQLEKVISDQTTGLYVIDGYVALPWQSAWDELGADRGTHGISMKTSSRIPINGKISNGKSKIFCEGGGFNAYLIGYINKGNIVYASSAFFWTSTQIPNNPISMRTRQLSDAMAGVSIQLNSKEDLIPVRCKKD